MKKKVVVSGGLFARKDEDISSITLTCRPEDLSLNLPLSKILRDGSRSQPPGIHDSNLFEKINPGSIISVE